MVDYFNRSELPGGEHVGPTQPTDSATYRNLYTVASVLVHFCVDGQGHLGWEQTGMVATNF